MWPRLSLELLLSFTDLVGKLRQAWVWSGDHISGSGGVGQCGHPQALPLEPRTHIPALTGGDTPYILIFCLSSNLQGGRQMEKWVVTWTAGWLCVGPCVSGTGVERTAFGGVCAGHGQQPG